MTIYIITYRYNAEAGSGVVGAYASEEEANRILELLNTHGDISKVFEIAAVKDVKIDDTIK